MVNFVSLFFTILLHLTLHNDDIHPLATFWPMEAINPSLQVLPLHGMMVLTPWMALLSHRRWLSGPPTPHTTPTPTQTTMEEMGGCSPIPPLLVN